ncbi:ubiquitin-specific protease doa4 [Coemansia nantahalensis]|uniref:Ubiquitin-specific protease doa4 n=1 Tax=Coemansia nantahalensis TaxID=2789366 RepID=A0ACC1K8C1_9FUNG|nr:ubiquitin-specific protease doa4 [Coemansia nantahalensis]
MPGMAGPPPPPAELADAAVVTPRPLGRASTACGFDRSSIAAGTEDAVLPGVRILGRGRGSNRAAVAVSPELPSINEGAPPPLLLPPPPPPYTAVAPERRTSAEQGTRKSPLRSADGSDSDSLSTLGADPVLVSTAPAPAGALQSRRVPPPMPAALLPPRPPAGFADQRARGGPPLPLVALPPLPSLPAAATSPRMYSQPAAIGSDPSLSGRVAGSGNPRHSGAFEQHAEDNDGGNDDAACLSPGGRRRRSTQLADAGSYGVTGLGNLGNTCFMNSVVQCLAGTEALARYFLRGDWRRAAAARAGGTQADVATEFAQLVETLWRGQLAAVSPVRFRAAVAACSEQFGSDSQEDAHEFASFLTDALHEALNDVHPRPPPAPAMTPDEERHFEALPDASQALHAWRESRRRNWSAVSRIFQGQIQSRLTCMTCGHTSTTYHTFTDLSVPIPDPAPAPAPRSLSADDGGSHKPLLLRRNRTSPPSQPQPQALPVDIYRCLDAYSETEVLDGDNRWQCPRCNAKRRATKRLLISRLPDVLTVHLKRFSTVGHFREKIEADVRVPTRNLHMGRYVVPGPHPTTRYNLYGVVNHYGSLSSGHYTAGVYSRPRNQWNYFDDTRVTPIDEAQVSSPAAYLLFFVQA